MNIAFSRFGIGDQVDLIRAIDAVCSGGLYMATAYFQPTLGWTHALDVPECPDHLLLIVRDDRHIVGWCRLFPEDNGIIDQVDLGIGLLAPYRLQGLGTTLVTQALDWSRRVGYQLISLEVHPDNAAARHVFEKCGFQYGVIANGQMTMTQRLFAEERHK